MIFIIPYTKETLQCNKVLTRTISTYVLSMARQTPSRQLILTHVWIYSYEQLH
jgi:hypothetical protein